MVFVSIAFLQNPAAAEFGRRVFCCAGRGLGAISLEVCLESGSDVNPECNSVLENLPSSDVRFRLGRWSFCADEKFFCCFWFASFWQPS